MEFFERAADPGVGYWGERTAAVDWCESNYTWSFYIAEFFNTITSLPAAGFACIGLYHAYKYGYDKRFILVNLLLAAVGLGSAAFHGTLLYFGQILDELPMVYAVLSFLYVMFEMESDKKPINKYLAKGLLAYSAVFTAVYFYLPSFFIFFVLSFICLVLLLAYRCSLLYRNPKTLFHQKVLILSGIGFYIGGWLLFWIADVAICERVQSFHFHSLWHVTSTLGGFSMLLFSVFQRELVKGRKPQLDYNYIAGIPLLPYIRIDECKEKISPSTNPTTPIKKSDSDSSSDEDLDIKNTSKRTKRSSVSNFRI